jgi:ankyrin repeat protein
MHLVSESREADHVSDIVSLLRQKGVPIEAESGDGYMPLNIAISRGRTGAATALLDHGADISIAGGKGYGLMKTVIQYGHAKTFELLTSRGVSIYAPLRNGQSQLHGVFTMEKAEVAEVLIKHGAPVDAFSTGQWSPLHYASSRNLVPLVNLLLRQGELPFRNTSAQGNAFDDSCKRRKHKLQSVSDRLPRLSSSTIGRASYGSGKNRRKQSSSHSRILIEDRELHSVLGLNVFGLDNRYV